MNYRRVEADILPRLIFTKIDALDKIDEKREREHQLFSAMALTSTEHEEVGLIVMLMNGEKIEVMSSHIEYGGEHVELKGGYMIPLKAIVKVEI